MPLALLTLTIQDAGGEMSPVSAYIDVAIGDTVESLGEDYAHVLWDVVRPMVNGVLVGANIALKADFSAWANNTFAVISDVEEKAVFSLRICGSYRPTRLSIPTIKESIFENGGAGKMVDMTNSDVVAFVAVITNGVVDGGVGMTDSHGGDVCGVVFGEQLFGKG